MTEKEIDINFHWIDEESAGIQCPYCKNENLIVGIYKDGDYKCKCGKQFRLIQINRIVEII